jgi:hypothetical protein
MNLNYNVNDTVSFRFLDLLKTGIITGIYGENTFWVKELTTGRIYPKVGINNSERWTNINDEDNVRQETN